ncbi:pyridine nucleotide-disulfide oxidoreductase [Bizionia gelidisalsuginis]|uniref:Pyridine nucleotide-disulfide oxidoreductase n=1 Tax=Bizionia gelidisalsuginis TaxID=291188 RepID=A0ABY3M8L9_9FLAO|nr:FAD-dependent oxidoreductase [Bizionia gelidisalsuginis]TYC10578.1 pyridine nucleotide-disulfide oxidoreductase [Bizionia gelidisalsuginis]
MKNKKRVLVLGCNFAGLTIARYLHKDAGKHIEITVIDRKNYINFIPNIPIEVFNNHNPADTLEFQFQKFLKSDGSTFIQAEVEHIDAPNKKVYFTPNERHGSAQEHITYDYLVIALGCKLAYDKIEGFAEFGHTFSDTFYGNEVRNYLYNDYKGGHIAIGSDRFIQGKSPKTPKIPTAFAACEGPPVELAFSMADWLETHKKGSAKNITLFTPADVIAEDAGETILNQLLPMFSEMGYGYRNNTVGIKRLYKEGIEFKDGTSLEAEMKIVFPNWEPHHFLKGLPFVDDQGFVVTDLFMRNPDYPEIFAVGDAAAITVPKLGSLGHMECEIASKVISNEILKKEEHIDPLSPMLLCYGDMGNHKGFYMHTDEWWGGNTSILKMGYTPYILKMGFKTMYQTLGGKIPSWGLPLSEIVGDHSIV